MSIGEMSVDELTFGLLLFFRQNTFFAKMTNKFFQNFLDLKQQKKTFLNDPC